MYVYRYSLHNNSINTGEKKKKKHAYAKENNHNFILVKTVS